MAEPPSFLVTRDVLAWTRARRRRAGHFRLRAWRPTCGISAASLAIARKGVLDLRLGDLAPVHIRGKTGSILLLSVGRKAVLSLVLGEDASAEPLLEAGRNAPCQLESLVSSGAPARRSPS